MNKNTLKAIEGFKKYVEAGAKKVMKACQLYVKAIDSDSEARSTFREQCKDIPITMWPRLEQIGRGTMDYRLLFMGGSAQTMLRKVPIEQQTKALDKGVEVLTGDGAVLIVKPENLTVEQRQQVFSSTYGTAPGKIRDLSAQKAILETEKTKKKAETEDSDEDIILVKGKKLHIFKPCILTERELKDILKRM